MNLAYSALLLASAISLSVFLSTGIMAQDEPSEEIKEARQESKIVTTLSLNQYLKDDGIEAKVSEGVATLTGTVSEDIKKDLAQQIALGVDGIEEVVNQIIVDVDHRPPTPSDSASDTKAVDDDSITTAVKSKLLWSKHAQELFVEVETKSGKVTLLGVANSPEAKEMAGTLAENTDGVESVDNMLTVEEEGDIKIEKTHEEPAGLSQRISDTWITTKVKSTLRYSSNVNAANISIRTKDGVVTLSGTVPSSEEHKMAIELTKNIRGVKRVETEEFHY